MMPSDKALSDIQHDITTNMMKARALRGHAKSEALHTLSATLASCSARVLEIAQAMRPRVEADVCCEVCGVHAVEWSDDARAVESAEAISRGHEWLVNDDTKGTMCPACIEKE